MKNVFQIFIISLSLVFSGVAAANQQDVLLKPFTLAKVYKNADQVQVASSVRQKLSKAGFILSGVYTPSSKITVNIVTNDTLLKAASKSKFGGFGAAIRVAVTQVGNDVQVSHTNPSYMSVAYNMNVDLSSIRNSLARFLGYESDFGGQGISAKELAGYRYSPFLENFYGFMDLAEHRSHQAAIAKVEAGFKKKLKNIEKVYRIDVPGKQQTIFGISMKADVKDQDMLNDGYIMSIIDNKELRRSAHLPYEIMVDGGRIMTLHPHFRIAINFPDLRMFGKNSFGKLMNLPFVYEEFLVQISGGQWPRPDNIDI